MFDNLSPDENDVYHLSWEIKDVEGNYFDVGKYLSDVYLMMGLYVEGDRQETYNRGLSEYGGTSHGHGDYTPATISGGLSRPTDFPIPPRPLNYSGIKSNTTMATIYIFGDQLVVNSPVSETVSVYSITGSLLFSAVKSSGEKNIDIKNIQDKICIVKGSSGWIKKGIKK